MSRRHLRMLAKAGRDGACLECGDALAARRGGAARALAALGREAERAAQQLLRQARGLRLPRLRPRRGAGGLCPAGASGAARSCAPSSKTSPAPAHADESTRHRRLLDPDLCGAAAGPRLRLRQVRHRRAASRRAAPPRRRASAARWRSIPFMVAGTGRFDTRLMEILGERAFVKVGAEGVYCAALPGARLRHRVEDRRRRRPRRRGRDGRAASGASSTSTDERARRHRAARRAGLRNWNGIAVGALRPAEALGSSEPQ